MGRNSLFPGFIKLFYHTNGHQHTQVLPVKPTPSGTTFAVEKIGGGTYDPWTSAMDAYALILKALIKTTDIIDYAELYTMASETSNPLFRENYSIAVAGTSSVADVPWQEAVFVWRTAAGGVLRSYIMENSFTVDQRFIGNASMGTAGNAYRDLFTSSAGFVFGRDGSAPIALASMTTKINDKLRKKFFLDV